MTVDLPSPPLKVAIVGGGPGGRATAIALQTVPNVDVVIYEQATVLREVGVGISISSNSWKVLELLGVADAVNTGHETRTVLNLNGRSGEGLHRREKPTHLGGRNAIRTQRTKLQSALLSAVRPETIRLAKKLTQMEYQGTSGIVLTFKDGSSTTADLVVGADGIRSVVRDSAFPDYEIKFTGTTIWRALLPWSAVADLDARFGTTAWWHTPTTHVYFSPVGEGLWEIAARAWHDSAKHSASKVSWGVPVSNEYVESHFTEYLPQVREALTRVPAGSWREFAGFAGPEMPTLTAWSNRVLLVGDSSHALSDAFGSGAGFAMEDGWILAQCLSRYKNDTNKALQVFNDVRLPYYAKMYAHLANAALKKQTMLEEKSHGREPTFDEKVRSKVVSDGGGELDWIYKHDIEATWTAFVEGPHAPLR